MQPNQIATIIDLLKRLEKPLQKSSGFERQERKETVTIVLVIQLFYLQSSPRICQYKD